MNAELLNKLKHLANIAAHLPHDVTLEDEDAAMKALHGELAADTVLQMIALAERALLAAAPTVQKAAEPVAWSYECQQDAAGAVWTEFINRTKPTLTERDGVRNIKPLYAAPAPIQQGQLVEVGQMIEFDDHEDPRFHTIICDWDNEARAKLTAGTKIYAVSAGSQVRAAGDDVQCKLGVGSGNGNLFVVGDYDSIKAAQAWILRAEKSESRLAEIQRGVEGLPTWTMRNIDGSYRDLVDLQQVLELLGKQGQGDTSGLPG